MYLSPTCRYLCEIDGSILLVSDPSSVLECKATECNSRLGLECVFDCLCVSRRLSLGVCLWVNIRPPSVAIIVFKFHKLL